MTGQRLKNDHSFKCEALSYKTVEYCSAFYANESKDDVIMLVLKLHEKPLFQRFFLDAGIGFWEEWNEEDTFYDLDDLTQINLAKEFDLFGKKVCSISCTGSFEILSSIEFVFENISLVLKFSDMNDTESNILLEKL